ncbi:M16 family metallopeptidase [Microbispora sp. ATCC PTA-5024]|uniref:M16 family metallopeptidase n=1 Tax=Microbispora sp. ATCC PTA-5024 TaxID=316330 RepID=UPI0006857A27|nr:pitrilysin family protein [Microbispora sp. ATCC PTA-5024]
MPDTASRVRLDCATRRLANGMLVIVCPDPAQSVAAVHLRYLVGSKHERPGRTGLAHLFEHLMFTGSPGAADGEHARLIQQAGGFANAATSMDSTSYFETVPSGALELVLWLEADRLAGLPDALDQRILDVQRDVVKNERRQTMDTVPYGTALELLVAALFPAGHPYHHLPIGSMADLDSASLDDARAFFETFYSPDRAVLTVVGQVEAETTFAWAERYFGGISRRGQAPLLVTAPRIPDGDEIRMTMTSDAPPKVFLAHRLPPAGTTALDAAVLAAAVLARGTAGVLSRGLVRGRALAAETTFDVVPLAGDASLGVVRLTPRGGTGPSVLERACQAELETLAETGVCQRDLDRAIAQLEAGWLSRLDLGRGKAEELSWHAMLTGSPESASEVMARIRAVPAREVADAISALADRSRRVVLTYQPA